MDIDVVPHTARQFFIPHCSSFIPFVPPHAAHRGRPTTERKAPDHGKEGKEGRKGRRPEAPFTGVREAVRRGLCVIGVVLSPHERRTKGII